mgnify:FL=1
MILMRKVKFIKAKFKTKCGICACLDNSSFNNESEKIIKMYIMILNNEVKHDICI